MLPIALRRHARSEWIGAPSVPDHRSPVPRNAPPLSARLSELKGRRLSNAEKRVSAIEVNLLPVRPPAELGAAHDLLVSSARLMREALKLHRGAAGAADEEAARNASAAAAGALLLLDTARTRIGQFFRPPVAP